MNDVLEELAGEYENVKFLKVRQVDRFRACFSS